MLSLLLFVFVATISPGGATTLSMASGMHFGIRRTFPLVFGLSVGLSVLAGSTSLGLATVILSSPQVSIGLKLAGSCYLIWLAWLVANARPPEESATGQAPMSLIKGMLLMWLSPKAWAMTLSASASFVLIDLSAMMNGIIFSTIFLLGALISLLCWAAAGQISSKLVKTTKQWRAVNLVMALLIIFSVATIWT